MKTKPHIPINERAILTKKMAAAYLSISESRLDQYRASKDVKAIEFGSRNLRYRRTELDALIDRIENKETHFEKMTKAS